MGKKRKTVVPVWIIALIASVSVGGYWYTHQAVKETTAFIQPSVDIKVTAISEKKVVTQVKKRHLARVSKKAAELQKIEPVVAKNEPKHVDIVELDKNGKKENLVESNQDEFQAGAAEIKLSKELPPIYWGAHITSVGSNANLFGDVSLFPTQFSDSVSGVTRVSVGAMQQNGGSTFTVGVAEQFFFKADWPSLKPYAGVGLNLPLGSSGGVGYNLFVGVERELSLFKFSSEKAFVELGVDSYSTQGATNSGFSFTLGYKVSL